MNYNVKVNGKDIPVFIENAFHKPYNKTEDIEVVSFIFDKEAVIEISSSIQIQSAIVRPISFGIVPEIKDGKILIKIDRPRKFSLEINGSWENNLIVFAESNKYSDFDTNAENIIYFPKGNHSQDILHINKDNTTVYLEEGAVFSGKVYFENCSNVKICGYGKITMRGIDNIPDNRMRALEIYKCRNVKVEDILIADSRNWSCKIHGCDNVKVENLKIIGCRGNSDGVDICGSRDVTVSNVFTRTWDDSFVLKAFDTGDCENVIFKDSVLWNDFARPIEVGVELRADNVRNITFDNIDIIHSTTGYPLIGIHHGDRAKVRNITFSNIRIEDTPGAQLFDFRITHSAWNRDTKMGDISDIYLKNIYYIGKPGMEYALSKSRIQGFDEEHSIKNVTIENINLLGKTASTPEECGLTVMDYVDNVKFICPENCEKINLISSKLGISKDFILNKNGLYEGTIKAILKNESNTAQKSRIWLQISPVNTAIVNEGICDFEIKPGEIIEKEFNVTMPAGKYVAQVQSDDINVNGDWKLIELDMIINKNAAIDDLPDYTFHNYYNTKTDNIKIGVKDDKLIIHTDILKNKDSKLIIYTAMPVEDSDNQVKFTVEETDFGEAPAVMLGLHGAELAPQLRCPAEITYVFKNEPKVKEIRKTEVCGGNGSTAEISFSDLGISGNNFWLEIQADIPEAKQYRYPFTLFHSVVPGEIAHMFANVIVK